MFWNDGFYIVGGKAGKDMSIIARLDATTLTWTIAGELNLRRSAHGALIAGSRLIVAGGWKSLKTEVCDYGEHKFTCRALSYSLFDYLWYPILFAVEDNYQC